MKEFLNAEPDFDFSWIPADIEQPDSIASEDLQTAINVSAMRFLSSLLSAARNTGIRSGRLSDMARTSGRSTT